MCARFLFIVLLLILNWGCNKSGTTELASGTFGLGIMPVSGNDQSLPAGFYSAPLVVNVTSLDGLNADGMQVEFSEITNTRSTVITPTVTVANGLASTRIIAPRKYDTAFKIKATIVGTKVSTVFIMKTLTMSTNLHFELQTSNYNVLTKENIETAGENFHLKLILKDELNALVDFYGNIPIYINITTSPSWTGQKSTGLPNPNTQIDCTFVAGICDVPITLNIKDALNTTLIWIGDGVDGIKDVSAEPIKILVNNQPGTTRLIALTDKRGGPAAAAIGYEKIEFTADDNSKTFYTAETDKAGNYLVDLFDVSINSAKNEISKYLIKREVIGELEFFPTKVTDGQDSKLTLSKNGYLTSNILVQVTHGKPVRFSHNINNGLPTYVGGWLDIFLSLTDQHDNIVTSITDVIPVNLKLLAGRRPTGIPDLPIVLPDVYHFNSLGGISLSTSINSDDQFILSTNLLFLQGKSYTSIPLMINNKFSNPSIRFETSKTSFTTSLPGAPPILVDSPPATLNYDSNGNTINKIDLIPNQLLKPGYIILRNPSNKSALCRMNLDYRNGTPPSPLPSLIPLPSGLTSGCSTLLLSSDSPDVAIEAYFVDANGNDIDADQTNPNTRDPITVTWTGHGSFEQNIYDGSNPEVLATKSTRAILKPLKQGVGVVQMTATIPNHPAFANQGSTFSTYIYGQISTGVVNRFEATLQRSPNTVDQIDIKFRAIDKNGVWIQTFTKSTAANFSYLGAVNSPKGTKPTLPAPTGLNFVNGEAFLTGIRTPKSGVKVTLNYSIYDGASPINGSISWTPDFGPLDHLSLNTGFELTGQDWSNTSFTVRMNDQRNYTVFPVSFDSEKNMISSSVPCIWDTQNIFAINQTTSIQVNFNHTTNAAKIICNYNGKTVTTGLITVDPAPLNNIIFEEAQLGPFKAGVATTFKLRLVDQYFNTITDPAQGANSNRIISFFGNNSTSGLSSVVNFPNNNISFTSGVSNLLSMTINSAGTNAIGFVDQLNTNYGESKIYEVVHNNPYRFSITRGNANNPFTAGSGMTVSVTLLDEYNNLITTGPGSKQKISITLSSLPTLDITAANLVGAGSVSGPNDSTVSGFLNNGFSNIQINSTKTGNFTVTAQSIPNAGNVSLVTSDPLSVAFTVQPHNPFELRWSSTTPPAASYSVNNSAWPVFRAEIVDMYGNINTNINATNSIVLTALGANRPLIGTTTLTPIAGVATFSDINYLLAGDSFQIKATYTNGATTLSSPLHSITSTVGPARNILLMFDESKLIPGSIDLNAAMNGDKINPGSTITAGTNFTLKAIATDAGFNKVPTYSGQVTLNAPNDPNITISPSGLQSLVGGERSYNVIHKKTGSNVFLQTSCTVDFCNNTAPYNIDFSHPEPRRLAVLLQGQTLTAGVVSNTTHCTNSAAATRTAGTPFNITVQATDDFCNIMNNSSSQVTLSAINDPASPAVSAAGLVSGTQTFTLENRTSGTARQVRATLSPSNGFTTPSFESSAYTVNPAAPIAANSAVTVTTTVVADNSSLASVTITLKDSFNNLVSGLTPVISISGTGNTTAQACSATNSSGVSTCTFRSTKAETKSITVTSPVSLGPVTSNFIAGNAVAVNSTITGTGPVTANGIDSTNITISLMDIFSNPVTGQTPTFNANGTSNNYTVCSTSNNLGISTCTMTSTKAESKVPSILTPVVKTGSSINFVHGPATKLVYASLPSSTNTAGVSFPTQPLIQIRDQFDNVVSDQAIDSNASATVSLTALSGSCSGPATTTLLSGTTTLTATAGTTSFSGINHTKAETLYLRASSGSLATACTGAIIINANSAIAANSSFAILTDNAVANNTATNSVRITLRDTYNNPVPAITPTLNLVSGTSTTIVGCGASDANGISDCTIRSLKSELKTLAIATPAALSSLANVNMTFVPGAATKVVFATQPSASAIAGVAFSTQPVLQIQDVNNNIVTSSSSSISLAAFTNSGCSSASTATLQGTTTLASSAGVANFTGINHTKAETLYIRASSGALTTACSTLTTVAHATPSSLAFTTQPSSSATAGVNFAVQPSVTVYDAFNNIATTAAGSITLEARTAADCSGAASSSLLGTTTPTLSSGIASGASNRYTYAESIRVRATYGTITACSSAVNVTPAAASGSFSTISSTTNITANGSATSVISITLKDSFDNPISGSTPTLSATGTSNVINCSTPTNASGQTTCTLSSTRAETKTVTFNPSLAISTAPLFIPGAPAQLAITTQPSSTATAGVNFTTQPVIQVRDAQGNLVTNASDSVSLAAFTNTGCTISSTATLQGTTTVAAASGVVSFAGINHTKAETLYLQASSGSMTSACSSLVTVSANAIVAANSTFTILTDNAVANNTATNSVRITLRDTYNNPVPAITPTLNLVSGTSTTIVGCGASDASGISDCTIRSLKSELKTLAIATPAALSSLANVNMTFVPGAATKVVFATQPSASAIAGVAFSTQPVLQIQDVNNNIVTSSSSSITLAAFTNSGCSSASTATLQGTTTLASSAGVANFTGINHTKAETLYIRASSGALTTACSALTSVAHATPSSLAFTTQPSSSATAGVNFAVQPSVTVYDAFNNIATTAAGSITLEARTAADCSGAANSSLLGTTTPTLSSGLASGASNRYTYAESIRVRATYGALTACSNAVNVNPAAASGSFSTISSTSNIIANGSATSVISITLKDSFDNPISGSTPTLASTGTSNVINCSTPTNASGQTTCTLSSTKAETKTVTFNPSLGISTAPLFIPGAPVQLAITTQPSSTATAGVNFATQPVIQVRDAQGNLVTNASDSVSLAAFTNSGCTISSTATLQGTTTVAAASGVVSFTGINHTKAETLYLRASSGSLTSACSSLITIGHTTASSIAFTTQPSAVASAGVNFGSQPVVAVYDSFNNLVANASGNITFEAKTGADCSGGSSSSLLGTTTPAISGGSASGSNIRYNVAESIRIKATYGALTACSQSVTVSAAMAQANNSTISASAPATANGSDTVTVTVTLKDSFNNPVNGESLTYTVTPNTGVTALPCSGTGSNGIYHCLVSSTKAETKTFDLLSPIMKAGPVLTFNPGSPSSAKSSLSASPTSLVANGSSNTTVTIILRDADSNPISNTQTAITIGPVTGTSTPICSTTNASGTATCTFNSTKAEVKTATLTTPNLAALNSSVTFTAGPAHNANSGVSSSAAIIANDTDTATINVHLADFYNNKISGVTPVLNGLNGSDKVSCGTTDINGDTNCSFRTNVSGNRTIGLANPGSVTLNTNLTIYPNSANLQRNDSVTTSFNSPLICGSDDAQMYSIINNGHIATGALNVAITPNPNWDMSTTCDGASLAPSQTCSVTITFKCGNLGEGSNNTLEITGTASGSTINIPLSGTKI